MTWIVDTLAIFGALTMLAFAALLAVCYSYRDYMVPEYDDDPQPFHAGIRPQDRG